MVKGFCEGHAEEQVCECDTQCLELLCVALGGYVSWFRIILISIEHGHHDLITLLN
jgi:hypothetical protein